MKIHLFDQDQHAVQYAAGQTVYQAGEPGEVMYAVLEGGVDLIIHGQTVETVEAGGVFGEMALIENQPRLATVVAKTPARLVPIDRNRFQFLVQQNPFFALQLMTIMAGRLRRMDEKL